MKLIPTVLVQQVVVPFPLVRRHRELVFLELVVQKTRLVGANGGLGFGSRDVRVATRSGQNVHQRLLSFLLVETQFCPLHRLLAFTQPLHLNLIDGDAIFGVVLRLRVIIHRTVSNIAIFLRDDESLFAFRVEFEVEPFQIGNILLLALVDPFPTYNSEQVFQCHQSQRKVLYLLYDVNFL